MTALLVIFTLANIFVAIILKSYQQVVDENPDANDSSQFIAMVLMQAKRRPSARLRATTPAVP